MPKENPEKTSMNIALTVEDKKFIKMYALAHDTNVSALFADYIKTLRDTESDPKE